MPSAWTAGHCAHPRLLGGPGARTSGRGRQKPLDAKVPLPWWPCQCSAWSTHYGSWSLQAVAASGPPSPPSRRSPPHRAPVADPHPAPTSESQCLKPPFPVLTSDEALNLCSWT